MTTTYETARTAYLQSYLQLLEAPPAQGPSPTFRGGGPVSPELLGQRASALAAKSGDLTQATAAQLKSGSNIVSANAASSLLEQASADLVVARTLLENIQAGQNQPSGVTQRAVGDVQLRLTAMNLNAALPSSLETRPGVAVRGGKIRPQNPADAVADLRNEVHNTLTSIGEKSLALAGKTARDLLRVASSQWNLVISGVQLVSQAAGAQDVSKNIEQGLAGALTGLVNAIAQIIVGVIAKINALLQGNPVAQQAVLGYLDKARASAATDVGKSFENFMDRLLGINNFLNIEMAFWFASAATTEVKRINDAADQVASLTDNYSLLAKQAQKLMDLIAAGSILSSTPALLAISFGLQVAVLTTVIFAAYDYVDAGGKGLNITKGVKEILVAQLGVTDTIRARATAAVQAAEASQQKASGGHDGTPPVSPPPPSPVSPPPSPPPAGPPSGPPPGIIPPGVR
jgi:hypothetical protein